MIWFSLILIIWNNIILRFISLIFNLMVMISFCEFWLILLIYLRLNVSSTTSCKTLCRLSTFASVLAVFCTQTFRNPTSNMFLNEVFGKFFESFCHSNNLCNLKMNLFVIQCIICIDWIIDKYTWSVLVILLVCNNKTCSLFMVMICQIVLSWSTFIRSFC